MSALAVRVLFLIVLLIAEVVLPAPAMILLIAIGGSAVILISNALAQRTYHRMREEATDEAFAAIIVSTVERANKHVS